MNKPRYRDIITLCEQYSQGCTQKNLGIKYQAPYQAIGAIIRKEIYVDIR